MNVVFNPLLTYFPPLLSLFTKLLLFPVILQRIHQNQTRFSYLFPSLVIFIIPNLSPKIIFSDLFRASALTHPYFSPPPYPPKRISSKTSNIDYCFLKLTFPNEISYFLHQFPVQNQFLITYSKKSNGCGF